MPLNEAEELELLRLERERAAAFGQGLAMPGPAAPAAPSPFAGTTPKRLATEAGKGLARGALETVGMVADAPARAMNLGVAGFGTLGHALFRRTPPDLPFDPNFFSEALRLPLLAPDIQHPAERFAATTGELTGAGITGGGLKATVPSLVAGLSGAAGEQLYGPQGQLLALAPAAVSLGLQAPKWLVRGPSGPAQERLATLERAGVSPTMADIAPRAAWAQKAVEGSPLGYPVARARASQRTEQIQAAMERADRAASPGLERVVIGQTIEKGLSDWKARTDQTYRILREVTERLIPMQTPVALPRTQAALESVGRSIDDPAISRLLEPQLANRLQTALAARAQPPTQNWPYVGPATLPWQTVEAIKTRIGNMAWSGPNNLVGDLDTRQLRTIYRALAEDQAAAAQSISPEAGRALAKQNAYYAARQARVEDHLNTLFRKVGHPEQIAQVVLTGASKDTERLRTLMKSLTPGERSDVARAVVQELGRAKPHALGEFSPEGFLTGWRRMSPAGRQVLFGHDAQLKADLDTLAKALTITRETANVLPNPSGTAPLVTATGTVGALGTAIWAGEPMVATAIAAAAASGGAAAALFTHRPFVHWLAGGLRQSFTPAKSAAYLSQLNKIATEASDPELKSGLQRVYWAVLNPDPALIDTLRQNPGKAVLDSSTGKRYALDPEGNIVELK